MAADADTCNLLLLCVHAHAMPAAHLALASCCCPHRRTESTCPRSSGRLWQSSASCFWWAWSAVLLLLLLLPAAAELCELQAPIRTSQRQL
jgi:hypothetical protein